MMKPFSYSDVAEFMGEGTTGVCLSCGSIQDGVEPDAEGYRCYNCDALQVMGFEQAIAFGYISVSDNE